MEEQMILQTDSYSPYDNKHFEGAMTQGNGYLNIRASFEEDIEGENQGERYWRLPANVTLEKIRNPLSKWGTYVPGIYGKHPILGEELVNLPYFLGINLYCCGERFDMGKSEYRGYKKKLDMKNSILMRQVYWKTKAGAEILIKWKRHISMKYRHCVFQEVQLYSDREVQIETESFLDAEVTTNGYDHFRCVNVAHDTGLEMNVELDSGQNVAIRTWMQSEENVERIYAENGRRITEKLILLLHKNKELRIEKKSVVVTDQDGEDDSSALKQRLEHFCEELENSVDELEQHAAIWEHLWNCSDVKIKGDEELQFSVRFSIYHLLRAANLNSKVAIDAKGYAGEAYFGHYFWDTEIYLLPFYIYTQPEQAKRLVSYRYHTLSGAKKNAEKYGYTGARYPWESCSSGEEQCSNWQYADLEVHVTADVIYGMYQYCLLTGDQKFLMEKGLELMLETARYWASRVREKGGTYHIEGVMGPDEYLPFTKDNAYTNYMVAYTLKKTLEVIEKASNERLVRDLHITEEECERYRKIAENIYIPWNRDKDFLWQSADFEEYEDIDFDKVWTDRKKPFGSCISQEHNYRCKALKQADTVMLFYLFRDDFSRKVKSNCINYYDKITTHDSSLSYIIHSIVYGDTEESEKSYDYAQKSMGIDWREKGAAEGIHIANAGGLWQGVVCGFGGLKGVTKDGMPEVKPQLPKHITEISYTICVRGRRYRVKARKNGAEIKEEQI